MAAVAYGLQNAHAGVVKHEGQRTREVHAEIADGIGEYRLRRAHQAEQRRGEQHAQNGHDKTCRNREGEHGMNGTLQLLEIARAEVTRHDHACAHGDAGDKANHQMDQVAGGADGGEGFAAQKVADDQGVCGVVQLLKQVAQKQGDGKLNQKRSDRPLGHQRCAGGGFAGLHRSCTFLDTKVVICRHTDAVCILYAFNEANSR